MERIILLPIAHGTEEAEAVTLIDLLRRAGMNVTVAGETQVVICSRGVRINPDRLIDDIDESEEFDAIILPGGAQGTENLSAHEELVTLLRRHKERGALIAAICAAPLILHQHNLIARTTRITSHPSVAQQLGAYQYSEDTVVQDGRIITSRGVGTAVAFALAIIKELAGEEHAQRIADQIVWR